MSVRVRSDDSRGAGLLAAVNREGAGGMSRWPSRGAKAGGPVINSSNRNRRSLLGHAPQLAKPSLRDHHAQFRFPRSRLSALLALPLASADEPADKEKPKHTNRLAKETSPYLLSTPTTRSTGIPGATEAFAKAKKENKLVFLSIGYSSCHWCHVMERESFNNEEVAKILNEHFVCIKVDREERPDIDQIYMTALNVHGQQRRLAAVDVPHARRQADRRRHLLAARGQGDRRRNGPRLQDASSRSSAIPTRTDPKRVEEQADKLADAHRTRRWRGISRHRPGRRSTATWSTASSRRSRTSSIREYGGFGNAASQASGHQVPDAAAPRFPARTMAERTKDTKTSTSMVTLTLDHMALGGIYDHLGGGFHRYSTERTWTVPHFEKMLYDNAQLVEIYAQAYRADEEAALSPGRHGNAGYVEREMTSPEGGVLLLAGRREHHEEGRFYVWTAKELDDASLTKAELALFREGLRCRREAQFRGQVSHPACCRKPLAEIGQGDEADRGASWRSVWPRAARSCSTSAPSATGRSSTPRCLTAWSGQMIAGYADGRPGCSTSRSISQPPRRPPISCCKNMRTKDGRLLRTYGAAPGQNAEGRAQRLSGRLCLPRPRPALTCTKPPATRSGSTRPRS